MFRLVSILFFSAALGQIMSFDDNVIRPQMIAFNDTVVQPPTTTVSMLNDKELEDPNKFESSIPSNPCTEEVLRSPEIQAFRDPLDRTSYIVCTEVNVFVRMPCPISTFFDTTTRHCEHLEINDVGINTNEVGINTNGPSNANSRKTSSHSCQQDYNKAALDEHNRIRRMRKVKPLESSSELQRSALKQAQNMAQQNSRNGVKYCQDYNDVGCNYYVHHTGPSPSCLVLGKSDVQYYSSTYDWRKFLEQWFYWRGDQSDFLRDYRFGMQIEAKNTTKLGCAMVTANNGESYGVCHYFPMLKALVTTEYNLFNDPISLDLKLSI